MIHLYTGDGKGKTTAAVGLAVRAAGRGKSVLFTQFMKGNDSGELFVLEQVPGIRICRSSKNFGFYRSMTQEQKVILTKEHNRILDEILRSLKEDACHMAVLDEITYPVNWGLLDQERLKEILAFGQKAELVMTGRSPQPFLTQAADYLTEMKALRHPYERGIAAREGIEL